MLNFVKKLFYTSILPHCVMYRVLERNLRQFPSKNILKDLGYITIINIPYYALKFSKEKCFILLFLLFLYCIVPCAGCVSNKSFNQLHIAYLRKNQEALQISVFSSLSLNLVEIDFFMDYFPFTELCAGHSAKKTHNRLR